MKEGRFFFGVANSAFQVEGQPAPSDWREWTYISGKIKDASNADRACEFWSRYEEDFDLARELGCNAFRLSLAWDRIETEEGKFDEAAVEHYARMLAALRDRGLEPFVTLHHFVLPAWLAARGGFLASNFEKAFVSYARFVVEKLRQSSAKPKYWMTFNEPNVVARGAYLAGDWPPGIRDRMDLARQAIAAMARAHNETLKELSSHEILWGVAHHMRPFFVGDRNPLSYLVAYMIDRIFNWNFLDLITGSRLSRRLDFIGLNYYGRLMIKMTKRPPFFEVFEGSGDKTDLGWEIYPSGLSIICGKIFKRYRLPIFITENGLADANDLKRSNFIREHFVEVQALRAQNVPIQGYFHWSLTDNFEWSEGLEPRFGLVGIDYQTQDRQKRKSFETYRELIHSDRPRGDQRDP